MNDGEVRIVCVHEGAGDAGEPVVVYSRALSVPSAEGARERLFEWLDAHPEVCDDTPLPDEDLDRLFMGFADWMGVLSYGHSFDSRGGRITTFGELRRERNASTSGHQLKCKACGKTKRVPHAEFIQLLRLAADTPGRQVVLLSGIPG